jgi:hypothetical protein
MDHDRSVGEGVAAQEYTGIKIQVLIQELEKSCSDANAFKVFGLFFYSFRSTIRSRDLHC